MTSLLEPLPAPLRWVAEPLATAPEIGRGAGASASEVRQGISRFSGARFSGPKASGSSSSMR